jgi:hypothetical protein
MSENPDRHKKNVDFCLQLGTYFKNSSRILEQDKLGQEDSHIGLGLKPHKKISNIGSSAMKQSFDFSS